MKRLRCGTQALNDITFLFGLLQLQFSAGIRLSELRSIAIILATFAQLRLPDRETCRRWEGIMNWYKTHWTELMPLFPLTELRDQNEIPINAKREFIEKKLL
jgi:hypothetical protein